MTSERRQLVWRGPVLDPSGYADGARCMLRGLDGAGRPVRLEPVRWNDRLAELDAADLALLERLATTPAEPGAVHLHNFLPELVEPAPGAALTVARTMYETDGLPAEAVRRLSAFDAVWVPSSFNAATFAAAGVPRELITVVPEAFDGRAYREPPPAWTGPRWHGHGFLSVFDLQYRKGWDVLLRAWAEEFRAGEPVTLVLRVHSSQGLDADGIAATLLEHLTGVLDVDPEDVADILVLTEDLSAAQLRALYGAADAFVLPTRGEGWGRPVMEAMAAGLPTVVTCWSALTEFVDATTALPVDATPVPVRTVDGISAGATGQRWAEPDPDHLRAQLRRVLDDPAGAARIAAAGRASVHARFDAPVVGRLADAALAALERDAPVPGDRAIAVAPAPRPAVVPAQRSAPDAGTAGTADRTGAAPPARRPLVLTTSGRPSLAWYAVPDGTAAQREAELLVPALGAAGWTAGWSADGVASDGPGHDAGIVVVAGATGMLRRPSGAAFAIARPLDASPVTTTAAVRELRRFDEVWVPTSDHLRALHGAGVPGRLVLLPPPLAERPDALSSALPAGPRRVLVRTDFSDASGWLDALRAWVAVVPADADAELLVWVPVDASGQAGVLDRMEQVVDLALGRLGRTRADAAPVRLLCAEPDDGTLARLHASATLVLAPEAAALSNAVSDALAAGRPLVAHRSGLAADLAGDSALLHDRPDGLADALRAALDDRAATQAAAADAAARAAAAAGRAVVVAAVDARLDEAAALLTAPQPARPDAPRVRWVGRQYAVHSLALVNREVGRHLAADPAVRLCAVTDEDPETPPFAHTRLRPLAAAVGSPLPGPVDVEVRHTWPPDLTPPAEGAWVLIQPWEFGGVPADWVAASGAVDEIWCPTTFVRDCYRLSGVDPRRLVVMPQGVDTGVFTPGGPRLPLRTSKRHRLLFVGGTIARKGVDVLLDAYLAAFGPADDVCLVVKTTGGGTVYRGMNADTELEALSGRPGIAEIEVVGDDLDAAAMAALYRSCTALVHPYRGEGFGLPVIEAMASGLPVAVTGYGACTDFVDESVGWLVPARVVPLARVEGQTPSAGWWWAEPDQAALVEVLHTLVDEPDEAARRGRAGRARAVASYDWGVVAARMRERLVHLATRTPVRSTR